MPRASAVFPRASGVGGPAPERPHCPAMTKGPPADACHDTAPGPRGPTPVQGPASPPLCHPRLRARLEPRTAFGGHLGDALGPRLDVLPRLVETASSSRRARGALPPAGGRQRVPEGAALGPPQAWRRAQPREAIAAPRPRPFRGREGASPVPAVFFRHPGDAHDPPHPPRPGNVAQAQGAPRVLLEASRLRPTATAIARKAGRVDAAGLHPLGRSTAAAPTAIPARLVAPDDAGVRGQPHRGGARGIPSCRTGIAPAGRVRSRGRGAAPVVKPRVPLVTPSSPANNRGGRGVVA
jgi:hypothetical protein